MFDRKLLTLTCTHAYLAASFNMAATFQQEYMQMPPITRAYTTACVLTTIAVVSANMCNCVHVIDRLLIGSAAKTLLFRVADDALGCFAYIFFILNCFYHELSMNTIDGKKSLDILSTLKFLFITVFFSSSTSVSRVVQINKSCSKELHFFSSSNNMQDQ